MRDRFARLQRQIGTIVDERDAIGADPRALATTRNAWRRCHVQGDIGLACRRAAARARCVQITRIGRTPTAEDLFEIRARDQSIERAKGSPRNLDEPSAPDLADVVEFL